MLEPREFDLFQRAAPISSFDASGTASCSFAWQVRLPQDHASAERNAGTLWLIANRWPSNRDEMGHVQYQNILKPVLSRYRSQSPLTPQIRSRQQDVMHYRYHSRRSHAVATRPFVFTDPFSHLPQCLSA